MCTLVLLLTFGGTQQFEGGMEGRVVANLHAFARAHLFFFQTHQMTEYFKPFIKYNCYLKNNFRTKNKGKIQGATRKLHFFIASKDKFNKKRKRKKALCSGHKRFCTHIPLPPWPPGLSPLAPPPRQVLQSQ